VCLTGEAPGRAADGLFRSANPRLKISGGCQTFDHHLARGSFLLKEGKAEKSEPVF
jgi:hypothetical protein